MDPNFKVDDDFTFNVVEDNKQNVQNSLNLASGGSNHEQHPNLSFIKKETPQQIKTENFTESEDSRSVSVKINISACRSITESRSYGLQRNPNYFYNNTYLTQQNYNRTSQRPTYWRNCNPSNRRRHRPLPWRNSNPRLQNRNDIRIQNRTLLSVEFRNNSRNDRNAEYRRCDDVASSSKNSSAEDNRFWGPSHDNRQRTTFENGRGFQALPSASSSSSSNCNKSATNNTNSENRRCPSSENLAEVSRYNGPSPYNRQRTTSENGRESQTLTSASSKSGSICNNSAINNRNSEDRRRSSSENLAEVSRYYGSSHYNRQRTTSENGRKFQTVTSASSKSGSISNSSSDNLAEVSRCNRPSPYNRQSTTSENGSEFQPLPSSSSKSNIIDNNADTNRNAEDRRHESFSSPSENLSAEIRKNRPKGNGTPTKEPVQNRSTDDLINKMVSAEARRILGSRNQESSSDDSSDSDSSEEENVLPQVSRTTSTSEDMPQENNVNTVLKKLLKEKDPKEQQQLGQMLRNLLEEDYEEENRNADERTKKKSSVAISTQKKQNTSQKKVVPKNKPQTHSKFHNDCEKIKSSLDSVSKKLDVLKHNLSSSESNEVEETTKTEFSRTISRNTSNASNRTEESPNRRKIVNRQQNQSSPPQKRLHLESHQEVATVQTLEESSTSRLNMSDQQINETYSTVNDFLKGMLNPNENVTSLPAFLGQVFLKGYESGLQDRFSLPGCAGGSRGRGRGKKSL